MPSPMVERVIGLEVPKSSLPWAEGVRAQGKSYPNWAYLSVCLRPFGAWGASLSVRSNGRYCQRRDRRVVCQSRYVVVLGYPLRPISPSVGNVCFRTSEKCQPRGEKGRDGAESQWIPGRAACNQLPHAPGTW